MKLDKKVNHLFALFILSVFLLPGFPLRVIFVNPAFQVDSLRISQGNEIIINSPKGTLDGPMDGYYPATFGFDDGRMEDWDLYSGGGLISVGNTGGHKGVLYLNDISIFDHVSAVHTFQSQTNIGGIEFWVKVEDVFVPEKVFIELYGGTENIQIQIMMSNGGIYYKDHLNEYNLIMSYSKGIMYHFCIKFGVDVDNSEYTETYGYILAINNDQINSSYIQATYQVDMDKIRFHTGVTEDCILWVDAIGFSWYEGYNFGDNRNEGIKVEFEPPPGIEFDETYYILDGIEYDMSSRTTMVIPMIGGGIYSLQIRGIAGLDEYLSEPTYTFEIEEVLPWGVDAIDAEWVWGGFDGAKNVISGNPAGQGVNVLVIDPTGFYDHEDLEWIGGYDWEDGDQYPEPTTQPALVQEHGTHCAGIIAAPDNGHGILGVAPKVNLFLTNGRLHNCIPWALDQHSTVDNPYYETYGQIDVISQSFVGFNNEIDYCDLAKDEGIIFVAAAGNSNVDDIWPPAKFDSTIAVGSVTYRYGQYVRSVFSSYGDKLDLVAPGHQIFSTVLNDQYGYLDGSSQACPHVAGVCALLISRKPDLRGQFDLVKEALCRTATKVGGVDYNIQKEYGSWHPEYGYGMVNAKAAMDYRFEGHVSIIDPPDGSVCYRGYSVTFRAEEFEYDIVSKVEYKIDSDSWNQATQIAETNIWKWTWTNTEDYNEGIHTITCRVTDEYGDTVEDTIQVNLVIDKEVAYQYTHILGTTYSGNLESTYDDGGDKLIIKQKFMGGWLFWQNWKSETEFLFHYSEYWFYDKLRVDITKTEGKVEMYVYFPEGYIIYTNPGDQTIDWYENRPIQKIVVVHTWQGLTVQYCHIDCIWIELRGN